MKYHVYIWVSGTEEDAEPLQSSGIAHADNPVQAAKKLIADIERLWGEVGQCPTD